jgi:uncharacterized protein YigE (DUF2233 family)
MQPIALLSWLLVAAPSTGPWQTLEPGLQWAELKAPQASIHGDSLVRVLRIDPSRFDLVLMNASAKPDGTSKTARQWANAGGLVAAINASMYQTDYKTSVALMQTAGHVNNSRLSKDNAVLAFDPIGADLPRVQIIDRKCQDLAKLRTQYRSLVQNIRMISCEGKNVWSQQKRRWSTAAVGIDRSGHVLFIHSRSPYSTHDFINVLLKLPLELKNAMYVEGGPEAQLFVRSGEREIQWVGSYETGLNEANNNQAAWPIPNVIGVLRREN